ncbi:putative baseplate assembly protein [Jatrophihabitans telluris]|uniref:Baseplate assembly protein n=1 Tax=Jatrophihabitans telluris TaxID=2038343 RepID=A0ABY4QXA4_9ACTN|nr:putative baseplate assembly protein [Jatrophihabitans telluris]UQX88118.1 putative baseplate assembly protein [Jatrophihabitans telluris]
MSRRVGRYPTFAASLRARLSIAPALSRLTDRDAGDPALALLDAWAVLGDVLTFYQERIANEGYLGTATDSKSLTELGRLVGHQNRPALAASTYLAYTLDPGSVTVIPAGSQAKSVPASGQLPQTFETSEPLAAREEWNQLAVRTHQPAAFTADQVDRQLTRLTLTGTAAVLRPGDRLLFLFGASGDPVIRTVAASTPDFAAGSTRLDLVPLPSMVQDPLANASSRTAEAAKLASANAPKAALMSALRDTLAQVSALPTVTEATAAQLSLDVVTALAQRLAEQRHLAQRQAGIGGQNWLSDYVDQVLTELAGLSTAANAVLREVDPAVAAARQAAVALLCPPDESGAGIGHRPDHNCDQGSGLAALMPILPALRTPPSVPPRSALDLAADPGQRFAPDSDALVRLIAAADPLLAGLLYPAWSTEALTPPSPLASLLVLRIKARPFLSHSDDGGAVLNLVPAGGGAGAAGAAAAALQLDAVYDGIAAGSWIVVETNSVAGGPVEAHARRVLDVAQQVVAQVVGPAGNTANVDVAVTVLTIDQALPAAAELNRTTVYAQGESLVAQGEAITDDVAGASIELARAYDGLGPGRRIVVTGERTDVPLVTGLIASEVVMIGGVRQDVDPDQPAGRITSTVELINPLAYRYRRATVVLAGNVVPATQGESRSEVLGSGDAAVPGSSFPLRQVSADRPLTAVASDDPDGASAALTVRVNGVQWHETDGLAFSGAVDHDYALRTDSETARVVFGDGVHGARPPSGVENITAQYRIGAGASGNLPPGQISQLGTRALGVNGVGNPVPASGGTRADGPQDARRVIPLRSLALDRLVSVQDYADFTQARTGFAKAAAARLYDGQRELVQVTVAAVDDAPLEPSSLTFIELERSLREFGEPHYPVRVDVRELIRLILSAGVKVAPDYSWDLVEPVVRQALLEAFGFDRQQLGEPANLSTALAAASAVDGVDYIDVDVFAGVPALSGPLDLLSLGAGLTAGSPQPNPCVPAAPARYDEDRYRVVDGDTLSGVADRFGLGLAELLELNRALDSNDLVVGQELVVFRGIRPAQLVVLCAELEDTLLLRRIP